MGSYELGPDMMPQPMPNRQRRPQERRPDNNQPPLNPFARPANDRPQARRIIDELMRDRSQFEPPITPQPTHEEGEL